MPSHDYRFVTRWRVESTPEEVYRVMEDTPGMARWWPSVWLAVEILESGDADGVGSRIRLHTNGWLPYTLCWVAHATEKKFPHRIAFAASGDFDGHGTWTFSADGPDVVMDYGWNVRADKPLLRYFSFILRPLFAANHNWAMARGLESLRLELARRHARSPEEQALVPPPPAPTFRKRELARG
jgi:hypothetical protein